MKVRVQIMLQYFYNNEAEQYLFFRIPQMLFTEKKFQKISCEAKVLYGLLLDRAGLSRKNEWFDNEGRLYIYYKQEEVCEQLNIGKDKVVKIFSELETVGLIYRKKQGLGKPVRIYVLNFVKIASETDDKDEHTEQSNIPTNRKQEFGKTEVKTSEKPKSELLKNRSLDFGKTASNHTESNHTESNHTEYQSYPSSIGQQLEQKSESEQNDKIDEIDGWNERNKYLLYVKGHIDYENILKNVDINKTVLDLIVDIIADTYNPRIRYMAVNGQSYSRTTVQEKFEQLNSMHIEYVWKCLQETIKTQKIKDLRKYLRTCLFNAPDTIDFYYNNQRQYDSNSTLNNRIISKNQQKTEKHQPKTKESKPSYDISILTDPAYMHIFLE